MVTSNTRSESGQKSVAAPYRLSKEIGRSRIKFRLGVCFRFSFRFRYYFFFVCGGSKEQTGRRSRAAEGERALEGATESLRWAWQSQIQSQSQSQARQGSAKQLHYRT